MGDTATHRLLIVDDDRDVCATIGMVAQMVNFDVRSVGAYPAFQAQLTGWSPDCLLIDLNLPDIDGVDILRDLAKQKVRTGIIIISGLGTRVLAAAARVAEEHGLRLIGTLAKPFSPRQLRALLTVAADALPAASAALPDIPLEGPSTPEPDAGASKTDRITRADLEAAIEHEAFEVHYQPKIALSTGALAGFEGLVRWRHPRLGLIAPDRFLPEAERLNLMGPLTKCVFEDAYAWFSANFPDPATKIALNMSASTLGDTDLIRWIENEGLINYLTSNRVILEITETSTFRNPTVMLELLTHFRIIGFGLAIDDFGVGYSSLVQLARLPFSELKIDRMFVSTSAGSEESRKIVSAVVGLGHALGLTVTAEGVEDAWTYDFLRDMGCDQAQGYFIARPMDSETAIDWAQHYRGPRLEGAKATPRAP